MFIQQKFMPTLSISWVCSWKWFSAQLWTSGQKDAASHKRNQVGERGKDSVFSFTLFCNDRSYWMQKNCTMLYKRDAWGLDHESYVISVCHTVFTLAWCDSLPAPLAQKLGQLHDFLVTLRTKGKGQNTISVQQVVVWGDGPVINKIST